MASEIRHPGKILYVDADGEKADHEKDASEVPESVRFVETPEGLVPVVKVVKQTNGDVRVIRQYGADGGLLRSTTQMRSQPNRVRRSFTTKP